MEDKEGNHVPFTRIILKFPMIREAFTSLHLCFHEYDVDKNGTMDHSELREAMSRLTGVEMPEDEAIELFNSGDMYDDGKISFKEFIVCLAIGYVLKTVIVIVSNSIVLSAKKIKHETHQKTLDIIHTQMKEVN